MQSMNQNEFWVRLWVLPSILGFSFFAEPPESKVKNQRIIENGHKRAFSMSLTQKHVATRYGKQQTHLIKSPTRRWIGKISIAISRRTLEFYFFCCRRHFLTYRRKKNESKDKKKIELKSNGWKRKNTNTDVGFDIGAIRWGRKDKRSDWKSGILQLFLR